MVGHEPKNFEKKNTLSISAKTCEQRNWNEFIEKKENSFHLSQISKIFRTILKTYVSQCVYTVHSVQFTYYPHDEEWKFDRPRNSYKVQDQTRFKCLAIGVAHFLPCALLLQTTREKTAQRIIFHEEEEEAEKQQILCKIIIAMLLRP